MNEQLTYNECPEGHMAPDEPTDSELLISREDSDEYDYVSEYIRHIPSWLFEAGEWTEGVVQPEIERWRSMPDKTMQDCMQWLITTHEKYYGYGYQDECQGLPGYDDDKDLIIESEELSLRLLKNLKEARVRYNSNGQYDNDIARYQEGLDSSYWRLEFECYLGELVELLEKHGHDKAIFRLALELIDHKLHGSSSKETKEVLIEIHVRLLGFD